MPRPRQRSLTQQDRDVWAEFARKVKPLPGHAVPDAPDPPPAPVTPAQPPAPVLPQAAARLQHNPSPPRLNATPAGLDRGTWDKFRGGKVRVEAVLDLHGHTVARAHRALEGFLLQAHAAQLRCVEIVTGRGQQEGGILRRELPYWLEGQALRGLILAAIHPRANPGAVRLLLRRKRQ